MAKNNILIDDVPFLTEWYMKLLTKANDETGFLKHCGRYLLISLTASAIGCVTPVLTIPDILIYAVQAIMSAITAGSMFAILVILTRVIAQRKPTRETLRESLTWRTRIGLATIASFFTLGVMFYSRDLSVTSYVLFTIGLTNFLILWAFSRPTGVEKKRYEETGSIFDARDLPSYSKNQAYSQKIEEAQARKKEKRQKRIAWLMKTKKEEGNSGK